MAADQLALLDRIFYANFRACGVDLASVRRAGAARALGDMEAVPADFEGELSRARPSITTTNMKR